MMVAFYRSKSLVQTRLNTFQRNCRCLIAVPDQLSPEDPADVTVIPGSVAFVTKKQPSIDIPKATWTELWQRP
ncbi:unnamed protein product [Peronospora destructor]|uniref:Uncharacterized protein n=1 Tax=Peronospora destructor TaxID=86335 RepID=A0AAV0U172_9STRA|nr:unnamed protein product [Peronospora destructor]